MKPTPAISLSLSTVLSFALLVPASAQMGNLTNSQNGAMQGSQTMSMTGSNGAGEAMHMVPARAVLDRSLNADKTKPGYQFHAVLSHKVQLDNGPELPSGTVLVGKVVTDDMNEGGNSKLALRFTHADLKNGQVVPIKATIVGVYTPQDGMTDFPPSVTPNIPNGWNDQTLQVDQVGVMSGVDLHSRIASMNSGVFVSSKNNLKLASGDEIALAIAAQGTGSNNMSGNNTDGNATNR